MSRLRTGRSHLAHAARVAGIASVVIALFYVAVVGALDYFVSRRVTWEVDQSLADRLGDVMRTAELNSPLPNPDDQGSDGVPIFAWMVPYRGPTRALTDGSPSLPLTRRNMSSSFQTVAIGGVPYRLEAARTSTGWLVVGQNQTGAEHIDQVLFDGEWILGPVFLLAVFAGSLAIGLRASAPVEQARRKVLEFTADASHELRTPLTVIEAEIELARAGHGNDGSEREALEHISHESTRLKQIVEDLLWLARFDATPEAHQLEPVDLNATVDQSARRFTAVAATRDQQLHIQTDAIDHVWVEATIAWVDRLVGTLVDNACRYTPVGGTISVSVRSDGNRAALAVQDSGPGIPPAERVRLFDRFHRASSHPEGSGLGLAIADSIARSTGGRWRVGESNLGGALLEVSWRRVAAPTVAAE
ncbi:MAG: HAMP domain-containing sensor histidine kinase [Actinomycetota bacterium]|nr:HAMP domain-containing sensor histidine kinase [Actinomycetota bacterium]